MRAPTILHNPRALAVRKAGRKDLLVMRLAPDGVFIDRAVLLSGEAGDSVEGGGVHPIRARSEHEQRDYDETCIRHIGIRIEDNVLITKDGIENLSSSIIS